MSWLRWKLGVVCFLLLIVVMVEFFVGVELEFVNLILEGIMWVIIMDMDEFE